MLPAGSEKNGTILPSHVTRPLPNSIESLEEKYKAADTKLLELEAELDVLFHYAHSVREQRTKMSVGHFKHSDGGATAVDDNDKFIDDYLTLTAKGKDIDDVIKSLKEECAASRSECEFLRDRIRYSTPAIRHKSREMDHLAQGHPKCGFVDSEAVADRIIEAESTATSVAGLIGTFGAGITYTTVFTASRGRLDLIAWAFTCFLIIVINSTALQVFSPPRHIQIARLRRSQYAGSVESRLLIYMLLVGIPLLAGCILLAVSVAVLDGQATTADPGSRLSIQASGYVPVALLGYFVVATIIAGLSAIIIRFLPSRLRPQTKEMRMSTSPMFPLKEKLYFIPGGPGYAQYRQNHILGKQT